MHDNSLVKKVFINLMKLNDMVFRTWVTGVRALAYYDVLLDNPMTGDMFKLECETSIEHIFISDWEN